MSILSWAEIELKHGKSNLSDIQWGRKVIQSIDIDDYITLAQLMNKKLYPDYDINIQTTIRGYAGYLWTISIHQFLGDTALHFALRSKKLYCVYMLIYLDADVNILNNAEERPLDMLQGIYHMTYENMKFDAKRQLIKKTHPKKLTQLPKAFLQPANSVSVEREAWNLMQQGCLLYSNLPEIMRRPYDHVNTAHAAPHIRRHLSFNLKTSLKDWKEITNKDGNKFYYNEATEESSYTSPPGWDNIMTPINPLKIRPHEPFVPKPERPKPIMTIDDVWSKGEITDIATLVERQKQRYYIRKLPSSSFQAQGLSLLSSVKLTSTASSNNLPSSNATSTTTTAADQGISEHDIPLPASTLLSSSSKTPFAASVKSDPNLNPAQQTTLQGVHNTALGASKEPPSIHDTVLTIPQQLLDSKGIDKLHAFIDGKADVMQLEHELMHGKSRSSMTPTTPSDSEEGSKEGSTPAHVPKGFALSTSDKQLFQLQSTKSAQNMSKNTGKDTTGDSKSSKKTKGDLFDAQYFRDIHTVSTRTNVKYMQIGNAGAKALATAFIDDPLLRMVILSNARIAHLGMLSLAPAIQTMHRIKYLDLSGNVLSSESGQLIANTILRKPNQLQILSLAGNRMGFEGVLAVIQALLQQQRTLDEVMQTLETSENTRRRQGTGKRTQGIRWCSVKNNQLLRADEEALMKLLSEEEDYDAIVDTTKKKHKHTTPQNKHSVGRESPSIFCRRRPMVTTTATTSTTTSESGKDTVGNTIEGESSSNSGARKMSMAVKYPAASSERDFAALPHHSLNTPNTLNTLNTLHTVSITRDTFPTTFPTTSSLSVDEKEDEEEEAAVEHPALQSTPITHILRSSSSMHMQQAQQQQQQQQYFTQQNSVLSSASSMDNLSVDSGGPPAPLVSPPFTTPATTTVGTGKAKKKVVAFSMSSASSAASAAPSVASVASSSTLLSAAEAPPQTQTQTLTSSNRKSGKSATSSSSNKYSSHSSSNRMEEEHSDDEDGMGSIGSLEGSAVEDEINHWLTSSSEEDEEAVEEEEQYGGKKERRERGKASTLSDLSEETVLHKKWKNKYILTIVI